jgi:hypothetical protein
MLSQQKHMTLPSQAGQTTHESVGADTTMIQTPAKATSSSRLVFVDNLKVALVILVVLHHFAVIYAGNTGSLLTWGTPYPCSKAD